MTTLKYSYGTMSVCLRNKNTPRLLVVLTSIYAVQSVSIFFSRNRFQVRQRSLCSSSGSGSFRPVAPRRRQYSGEHSLLSSGTADLDVDHHRNEKQGQSKYNREKPVRREDRISFLATIPRTGPEEAEFRGLLEKRQIFEEQYDASVFPESHILFKKQHNEAFLALAKYCQATNPKIFYLDGPDGATTSVLEQAGFNLSDCYIANRHKSTCQTLHNKYPTVNIVHASAAQAFVTSSSSSSSKSSRSFANVGFCAYYFDGCGGLAPQLIEMMGAALSCHKLTRTPNCLAIGFTLLGGNRDVVEKELHVCRTLSRLAKDRGMRTRHVLEDPERYGISTELAKTEGGTFTSWILLEQDS